MYLNASLPLAVIRWVALLGVDKLCKKNEILDGT